MRIMHRSSVAVLTAAVLVVWMGVGMTPQRVVAQSADALAAVDELLDDEDFRAAERELQSLLTSAEGAGRGEILWRLAQARLIEGDQLRDSGASDDDVLAVYESGEAFGQEAIEAAPNNPETYYWTSANIGRWGQTKGVLNSLFRAPDMRDLLTEAVTRDPEHADSYYVLGQLYAQVPGGISFGNAEYAVSLGRLSVELMEAQVASGERDEASEAFYVQLASHLINRGWNSRRRQRAASDLERDYRNARSAIERGFYHEGRDGIPAGDDRAEAREILEATIRRLERISNPLPSDRRQLEEARELLAET